MFKNIWGWYPENEYLRTFSLSRKIRCSYKKKRVYHKRNPFVFFVSKRTITKWWCKTVSEGNSKILCTENVSTLLLKIEFITRKTKKVSYFSVIMKANYNMWWMNQKQVLNQQYPIMQPCRSQPWHRTSVHQILYPCQILHFPLYWILLSSQLAELYQRQSCWLPLSLRRNWLDHLALPGDFRRNTGSDGRRVN